MRSKPYQLARGGAIRIRRHDEMGAPEVVAVSAAEARRGSFKRLQFLPAAEEEDLICAVFEDARTGDYLAQPIPDQEGV